MNNIKTVIIFICLFLISSYAFAGGIPTLRVAQVSGAGLDVPVQIGINNEAFYEVTNTTNHAMRDMQFSLENKIDGMEIDLNNTNAPCVRGSTLNSGASCHIKIVFLPTKLGPFTGAYLHVFSTKDDVRGATSGIIEGNVEEVLADIETHTETDLPYVHLSYKAIVVKNVAITTPRFKATAASVGVSALVESLSNKAIACFNGTAGCGVYSIATSYVNTGLPTTLCAPNQILASGESCHFWVSALTNEPADIGQSQGTVKVKYYDNEEGTFNVNYSQDLYIGGASSEYGPLSVGGIDATGIAKWTGTSWQSLNNGTSFEGTVGPVFGLKLFDGDLYVGGRFTTAGGHSINNIGRWYGSDWDSLPSGFIANNGTNGLAVPSVILGEKLYVSGDTNFTTAGPPPNNVVNHVAMWDPTTSSWSSLDGGVSGPDPNVYTMTVLNGQLYAGGFFTTAGSETVLNIAKWDPNSETWSALTGGGLNDRVYSLEPLNGILYAGGLFTDAGGVSVNYIAKWTQANGWSSLPGTAGNGLYGGSTVWDLYTDGSVLYVGSDFGFAGSPTDSANNIAAWDPVASAWSSLPAGGASGNGITNPAYVLTIFNGMIYAGSFDELQKWDGNSWNALVDGQNNEPTGFVQALAVAPSLTLSEVVTP